MHQELTRGQLWGVVLAAGEGTRVRDFLQQLCGGRGIKQFCTIVGRRSLLEHTLARVERLIPRERIVVVVSADHQDEVVQQLAHWPADNVIFQPANRDTAPGILLPLSHVMHQDSLATIAIFPSDHFILDEELFMAYVQRAVDETQCFPHELTLLGMTPDQGEKGYGWIEPGLEEMGRATRAVLRFWEKPSALQTYTLLRRKALWNTFVCVAQAVTIWEMVEQVAPDLTQAFRILQQALGSSEAEDVLARMYTTLRPVNFSVAVCEPLSSRLRVLPVPDVGWSDWGNAKRICDTLQRLGKMNDAIRWACSVVHSAQQRERSSLQAHGKADLRIGKEVNIL